MASGTDSIALVVGGTGAIGGAIIDRLVRRGHAVVASYCERERPAREGSTVWVRFDVDEPATATSLAEALCTEGRPLRTVVYAAGAGSTKRRVVDTPLAEFQRLWLVNALGFVAIWHSIAPLARTSAASVVVIGSQAARTAGAQNGPYSASKSALEAIAATLAKEEAVHGIRVNVVSPSLVASPMAEEMLAYKGVESPVDYYTSLPFGRALNIGEVADLTVEVAVGNHWRYASGQVIRLAADVGDG